MPATAYSKHFNDPSWSAFPLISKCSGVQSGFMAQNRASFICKLIYIMPLFFLPFMKIHLNCILINSEDHHFSFININKRNLF
uniref:Uncharacterized protein n=1 Tax=Anguilla anguilla TaxID=7936 RepID=A0A0E9X8I0_ANGAN